MKTFTEMVDEQQSQKSGSSSTPALSSTETSEKEVVEAEIVLHKAGAPTKLTPQVHETLVHYIRTGKPILVAVGLCRVSKSAFYDWLNKGDEDPEGPYGEFALDVAEAQAAFKAEILDKWYHLGVETKQWTAMATLLERLFPEEFKRPSEKTTNVVNIGHWEQVVHQAQQAGELPYTGS